MYFYLYKYTIQALLKSNIWFISIEWLSFESIDIHYHKY